MQVAQQQNMVCILNKLLNKKALAYNIGQNAHGFVSWGQHISFALETYKPTRYAVIEPASIEIACDELKKALLEPELTKVDSSEFFKIIKHIPYYRLVADQYIRMNVASTNSKTQTQKIDINEYSVLVDAILKHISDSCKEHNVQPIILYHEQLFTNKEGKAYTKTNSEILEAFSTLCEKNEIVFINLTDTFIENYEKNHVFPHGFENTSPGAGHLNKYGHEMAQINYTK